MPAFDLALCLWMIWDAANVSHQGQNLRWSIGFVADTLGAGRRFRILTLVDDFKRCSILEAPFSNIL